MKNLIRILSLGLILFSAATPGQGGENHLNEQPHEFWRALFADHGYRLLDFVRPRIREHPKVESWYRYNSFLFASPDRLSTLPGEVQASALDAEATIPTFEPLGYRMRRGIMKHLPQSSIEALARLKHNAVLRARQRGNGGAPAS